MAYMMIWKAGAVAGHDYYEAAEAPSGPSTRTGY